MDNFQEKLKQYARLAIEVGVNIQKDQTLVINAPIEALEFVREAANVAYDVGAKNVHVEWSDEVITRTKYEKAPDEAFMEFPTWRAKGLEEMAENGAAFMSIHAANPDLLKGIDPKRISNANKASASALENYRSYIMADKVSWTVISVPTKGWAQKVFPNKSADEAMSLLWDAIFNATRVNEANPVQAWENHKKNLHAKVDILNAKKYKSLHYTSKGTDLHIELPEKHLWIGVGSTNEKGNEFVANMPTEEVFTTPSKSGVNGIVVSTKPLNYGGNVIENFSLTFKNGEIVEVKAEAGEETLKELINTDEGSKFLGEVALVPHDSPISNSNIIFYNTLFDENASCHLAIGNAYSFCLEGGKTMSKDELKENGLNASLTHVDFMIGSADLNIDGITTDGKKEAIFRNGNWAF